MEMNAFKEFLKILIKLEIKLKEDPSIGNSIRLIFHRAIDLMYRDDILLKNIKITRKMIVAMAGVYNVIKDDIDDLTKETKKNAMLFATDSDVLRAMDLLSNIFEKEEKQKTGPAKMKARRVRTPKK